MKRVIAAIGMIGCLMLSAGTAAAQSGRWLTGYYPAYRQFEMPPSAFDASVFTHIVHWPVIPLPDGTLDADRFGLTAEHSADVIARAHAVGTKVLLGVGGDASVGANAAFQTAAAAPQRAGFVSRIANLAISRGYDGVDINWEGIRSQDGGNFVALIDELRSALGTRTLTIVPTNDDAYPGLAAAVRGAVDQINLQTYVLSGPYPGWVTWFNSPIFNGGAVFPSTGGPLPSIDAIVNRFVAAGTPAAELALGVQLDGFFWAGGTGTDTGGVTRPRQEWSSAPDVWVETWAETKRDTKADLGFSKIFDEAALVPFKTRDLSGSVDDRFVSFENRKSIRRKAEYAAAKGLGGIFLFEISGDYRPEKPLEKQHVLLNAARDFIRGGFVP